MSLATIAGIAIAAWFIVMTAAWSAKREALLAAVLMFGIITLTVEASWQQVERQQPMQQPTAIIAPHLAAGSAIMPRAGQLPPGP
jgi:hypothetical protein